ncbi:hypothetical protein ONZ51_g231 [Trametes cubensis]|uniref:Uncharacterized protein n=1 Tax=Trametes cubensis TaxID=1111947 RepID=A0AAD7XE74_9APHY|nr:hypothetical protein ONZ51_g231 [Trametes cubensis]
MTSTTDIRVLLTAPRLKPQPHNGQCRSPPQQLTNDIPIPDPRPDPVPDPELRTSGLRLQDSALEPQLSSLEPPPSSTISPFLPPNHPRCAISACTAHTLCVTVIALLLLLLTSRLSTDVAASKFGRRHARFNCEHARVEEALGRGQPRPRLPSPESRILSPLPSRSVEHLSLEGSRHYEKHDATHRDRERCQALRYAASDLRAFLWTTSWAHLMFGFPVHI